VCPRIFWHDVETENKPDLALAFIVMLISPISSAESRVRKATVALAESDAAIDRLRSSITALKGTRAHGGVIDLVAGAGLHEQTHGFGERSLEARRDYARSLPLSVRMRQFPRKYVPLQVQLSKTTAARIITL
jgi:hypothetical protein